MLEKEKQHNRKVHLKNLKRNELKRIPIIYKYYTDKELQKMPLYYSCDGKSLHRRGNIYLPF